MKLILNFIFMCLAFLGFAAQAQAAVDTAAVVTEIGTIAPAAAAIGAAMLIAIVGIKVWKMIRRAL